MPESGIVLVSGGSGFLGRQVCRAWASKGRRVRALQRSPHRVSGDTWETVTVPDLVDGVGLREALDGVDTVIHLAGRVHLVRDPTPDPLAEYRRVNVEGTRVLLRAAIEAGVRRFVFTSSVKVMGEHNTTSWTEDTSPRPEDPYGTSKLEAEMLVRELARAAGLHAPILRLPLVYGPGQKANMLRLFDLVARGTPLPLGAIQNRRSLAFSGNVLAALEAVLAAPGAGAETFFVSDGQDLSTPELVRAIASALGVTARLVSVPAALLRLAAWAGDGISAVIPWPLTSPALDRLTGSLTVDISKLRRVTGFNPPFEVAEGMRQTADWFRRRTLD